MLFLMGLLGGENPSTCHPEPRILGEEPPPFALSGPAPTAANTVTPLARIPAA